MTRGLLQKLTHALLHTGDSPERTAAAFSVGVLMGFSPFLTLHTVLALVIAFTFRLNRLAVLAGTYSNLPWFMGPYYAVATAVGALLVGVDVPADLGVRVDAVMALPSWRAQIEGLYALFTPFLHAYIVGSSLGCTLLAALAYWPALRFVERRRRHHPVSPDFRQ